MVRAVFWNNGKDTTCLLDKGNCTTNASFKKLKFEKY